MSDKGITLEGLAAAVDALRQELATWKALAHKQDQLSADQITATQSGATAAKISQIAVNTAAIQSLAAQVAGQISLEYVSTLPATGEPLTLYLVPQGDGTAPNYCNEYLWINDAWELIGTTGAMANNGELTIQVNGVAVGTFTANQAANAAVNITVPTNTNQLVNGAQYVDAAALQAALALKQNSLNTAQLEAVNSGITAAAVQQIADNATAIAGKQDALTTAQQAAVDSGATAAKIDQIASNASAIVSLTSSKQDQLSTMQLAAVNSGVTAAAVQQISTNADAIATKAADSEVVHLAGAETISGDKTWTGLNTFQYTVVFKDATAVSAGGYGVGLGFFDYAGSRYGYIQPHVTSDGTKNIVFGNSASGYLEFASSLVPYANNVIGLGTSSNAWLAVYANAVYANTSFAVRYASKTASGQSTISGYLSRGFGVISSDDKYFTRIFSTIAANYSRTAYETYLYDSNSDVLAQIKIQHGAEYNSSTGVTSLYARPTASGVVDLGGSSHKWKTLNGINPGALSFPANSYVDIDTTGWTAGGTNRVLINNADPTYPGWLFVRLSNIDPATDYCLIRLFGTGNGDMSVYGGHSDKHIMVIAPVPANTAVRVYCSAIPAYCRYYACLGNV